jgi:sRNA-binding protein
VSRKWLRRLKEVKAKREAKKAEKEAGKAAKEAEEATTGKRTRSQKRKSPVIADAPGPMAKMPRISEVSGPMGFQIGWLNEEQQIASMARLI